MRLHCACRADMGRRGFLRSLGALSGLAATGCAFDAHQAAPNDSVAAPAAPGSGLVDVHHHIVPTPWLNALIKAKLDTPPVARWNPQHSLDDMDRAGIAMAMTSPTQPAVGFLPAKEAAYVARASNEYAKRLADEHPGRFGLFALLPMPHVDETLAEIAYAIDVLKFHGVAFMTSYDGRYLGDAAFAPVMNELQRRKAVAYTHPNDPACCRNLATGVPPVIVEYGTDTTRTVASLIFSGTAQRCPNVSFIFSHAGGTLTSLTDRFTVQAVALPQLKEKGFTAQSVDAQIRRFFYDTAQAANPVAMAALTRMVPISQIVLGTDFPYRTAQEHVQGLAAIFSKEDLALIEQRNARRLIGIGTAGAA